MSPVLDVREPEMRAQALEEVVPAVSQGSLVVLPTDTVYGVGCDAFASAGAIRVLAAKGRGRDMPVAVLVPSVETVDGLAAEIPAYARALMEKYWPGPLTLVLTAQPSLQWDLGDAAGTVGVRQPDDAIALELLRAVGPMAVSSANRTGAPAATSVLEAATMLGSSVEYYLDGGPRAGVLPSTIVDCTGLLPVVLREGAILTHEIEGVAAVVAASTPSPLAAATAIEDDEPLTENPFADQEEPEGTSEAADSDLPDSETPDTETSTSAEAATEPKDQE